MDPRFQPQNNPSQNQAGPGLYPTLPPLQNPQYQPPAQYHPASHGGYVQLANHGNGPHQAMSTESFLNIEKMRELEMGLNTCFLKCYNCWLWLTIICCGLTFFRTVVALGYTSGSFEAILITCGSLLYTLWAIAQSLFGVQAISEKSLTKANMACWMMVISLIPNVIAIFYLIIAIVNYVPDQSDANNQLWYGMMEYGLGFVIVNTLIALLVNVNGAFKVRNILTERNVLQEKIDRANDAIYP